MIQNWSFEIQREVVKDLLFSAAYVGAKGNHLLSQLLNLDAPGFPFYADWQAAYQRGIEQNLAVIDRAIADARRALAADPGNPYLSTYLAHTMRRKIDLLRQAATIAASRS